VGSERCPWLFPKSATPRQAISALRLASPGWFIQDSRQKQRSGPFQGASASSRRGLSTLTRVYAGHPAPKGSESGQRRATSIRALPLDLSARR